MTTTQTDEYDSPWKEAIERFFKPFLLFFFPQVYNEIDWSKGYEFLDKELQKIMRDAKLGKRLADKLVKVWLNDGSSIVVLIHIEVQSQVDKFFAKRMFIYFYRISDRYDEQVVSLALLGDDDKKWRPDHYSYELWGNRILFEFSMVKLLDYTSQWSMLEQSTNPFATVVMAHLKTQQTRNDAVERKKWKYTLMRQLYEKGYSDKDIKDLIAFVDWIMYLPEELDKQCWQDIHDFEEAQHMPYVTSIERIGIKKGFEQGFQQGIEEGIEQGMQQGLQQGMQQGLLMAIELVIKLRFGNTGADVLSEIRNIDNPKTLQTILEALETATTLDEVRRTYATEQRW